MKQEFEMTQEEMDDIIAINKNQSPVMKFGDYWSGMDLVEKVNHYWQALGNKYGFNHMTAEGSARGKLFFLAEPKPIEVPKTAEEKAIEQYDSIEKIVTQLESCNYECEGGYLKNNVAFLALKKMTNLTTHE